MRYSVPLKYRLPNPSEEVEAIASVRKADVRRLVEALNEHRVVLIGGPENVGQSELIRQVFSSGVRDLDGVLFVALRPGEALEHLLVRIVAAAKDQLGAGHVGWAGLATRDELVARVMDFVDSLPLQLVVDGVDWARDEGIVDFVETVQRYAREGRWCFTGFGPPPEIGQRRHVGSLMVERLTPAVLRDLARAKAGPLPDESIDELVLRAQGSPVRLLQLLDDVTLDGQLRKCTEPQRRALALLSQAEALLPAELLGLREEAAKDLEGRGLLVRYDGHLTTSSAVKSALRATDEAEDLRRELSDLLEGETELELVLERLRLLLSVRDLAAARRLLDEKGGEALFAGRASGLYLLLREVDQGEFERWKVLTAVHAGQPLRVEVLREGHQKWVSGDGLGLLAYVSALYAASRFEQVVEAINEREQGWEASFRLRLIRVSALTALGRLDEAARRIDELPPPSDGEHWMAAMSRAGVLAAGGEHDAAVGLTREVLGHSGAWSLEEFVTLGYGLLRVLVLCNAMKDAAALLTTVVERVGSTLLPILAGRGIMILQCIVALATGDLLLCQAHLARIKRSGALHLYEELIVDLVEARRRLYAGELAGLDEEFARLEGRALESGLGDPYMAAVLSRALLSIAEGRRPGLPGPALAVHDRSYVQLGEAYRVLTQMLWEELPAFEEVERLSAAKGRAQVPGLLVAATHAALLGDARRSQESTSRALAIARDAGTRLEEIEILITEVESRLLLGSFPEAEVVEEIQALAERVGSARFGLEAQFFNLLLRPRPTRGVEIYGQLEVFASRKDVAPAAARRSRWLLGEEPSELSVTEQGVLGTLEEALPYGRAMTCEGSGPSWGVDVPSWTVWFADGRTCDFEGQEILWQVLVTLSSHGGYCGKEALISSVWGIETYHPLRHDNRLRLAVSKIRRRIREAGGPDGLIEFGGEGYQLGGSCRVAG